MRRPLAKIVFVRIGNRRQQFLLVAEVIVDIAKRYARRFSDVGERGSSESLIVN